MSLENHKTLEDTPWKYYSSMDTLKAFNDFENKQKSVCSNVSWYVKVCIFWKCIQYTIYWDKTQMLKKIPSDKIDGTKNALFVFPKLQLIIVLLLICYSYMNWSTWFVSLKLCVRPSIFDSVPFLLKITFLLNKMYGLFVFKSLKRHHSFQSEKK